MNFNNFYFVEYLCASEVSATNTTEVLVVSALSHNSLTVFILKSDYDYRRLPVWCSHSTSLWSYAVSYLPSLPALMSSYLAVVNKYLSLEQMLMLSSAFNYSLLTRWMRYFTFIFSSFREFAPQLITLRGSPKIYFTLYYDYDVYFTNTNTYPSLYLYVVFVLQSRNRQYVLCIVSIKTWAS